MASANWQSVAYGNGTFVAVAAGPSTAAAYSTNGTTWSTAALPASASWSSVAYGNGTFVAVVNASSTAAISSNGTTWTATSMPSNANWSSVTYGNGTFVAVADGGTAAAYLAAGLSLVDANTTTLTGPATQLVISTQPSASGTSGTALATQPVVELEDASGNVVTIGSSTVTANFTSGGTTLAATASRPRRAWLPSPP